MVEDARAESPLFEKMDALMRKHRGGAEQAQEIPVLIEEVSQADAELDLIPVLTDALPDEALWFETNEISAVGEPVSEPFLDLPLLDLDEIARSRETHPETALDAIEPESGFVEEIEPAPGVAAMPGLASQSQPEAIAETLPAMHPDEDEVAEITAMVAAQIAVEVSTEVEQLARQYFAGMMSRFLSESMSRITDEISDNLEKRLMPRIEELVRQEWQRKDRETRALPR